jgi:hypothetical protein
MSISAAWLLSAVLAILPAILIEGLHTEDDAYACVPEKDTAFLLMSSTFVFYIPCIVTISFYYRVLKTVTIQTKRRIAPSADTESQMSRTSRVSNAQEVSLNSSTVPNRDMAGIETSGAAGSSVLRNAVEGRNVISLAGEKKTLTVLLVVLGCFIVCWLPFFIFLTTQGLCTSCAMTPKAFHSVRWLGWCNSILNPVLYSIFNRDFREAFKRIIFCRK